MEEKIKNQTEELNDDVTEEKKPAEGIETEKESVEEEEKINWGKEIRSWILIFVIAMVAAWAINSFVIVNATVPTESMMDTIQPGDRLLGLRFSYAFSEPKRGDIIVFKYPDDESQNFVKRIIGLPGETIHIEDGKIYINGKEWEDGYNREDWDYTSDEDFVVPEDSYFMLGDNRNNSKDSRYWTNTYVKKDKIIGKVYVKYWPFNRIGKLK